MTGPYDGDVTRCPWCHAHWDLIIRSGWHSCEVGKFWRTSGHYDVTKERVRVAQEMRLAASEGRVEDAAALGGGLVP